MTFDLGHETDRHLEMVRAQFLRDGEMCSFAWLHGGTVDAPTIHAIAMPDADQQEARRVLQERADECGGFFVVVAHEAWAVTEPRDPAGRARVQRAAAERTLDKLPERREIVMVFVESADAPIRRWEAEITRPEGGLVLGPWVETRLTLPRPGFKRYLVEKLPDGKRLSAFGIRIGMGAGAVKA